MPLDVELNLTNSPYIKTAGARMAKYEVDRNAFNDGKSPDNDIVLFRYADVLLMKAEAAVRNGENGNTELNLVRSRSGMGNRTATLDNILAERLMELMWEAGVVMTSSVSIVSISPTTFALHPKQKPTVILSFSLSHHVH